ncbi:MAG: SurA N-terminal domain-containing protein [Bacteroidales bacterium]|nr:SurA N-terminal domain-containing protein [Bacteroidales bacterium]
MATLQNIRNRAGLLVAVVIGLALFAFILGDMMGSGAGSRGKQSVAEINGKGVGVNDYMNREKALREFYELNAGGQSLDAELERQIQQETWRRLIRETIMERSYEKLGIYVSADELKTMITGDQTMGLNGNPALSEPHPIIRQMFSNPETGQLNRAVMTNYFNSLDNPQFAQEKKRWLFIENEIVEEKMNQKYFNLVRKGFQPSSLDLKDYVTETGKSTDFAFISRPFTEIADEDITITDSDLKACYKKHQETYKQDASRTFQYIVFEVEPSEKDIENARYWSSQTMVEYSRISGEEIPRYVNGTSDEPFDERYYTYEELPVVIRDSVFNAGEETVFGPYRDQESYKLARAYDAQMRADSTRVRHILLSLQAYGGNRQVIGELADSLKGVIENGGNFNQIALEYSADESNRAIGGDLGWFKEGNMVTAFNNVCFENSKGDIVTAETQFGTHIIKIEDQSRPVLKIQVATVVRNIFASDETNQDYYNRAVRFRSKATDLEKFTEQAREFGLDPRFAPNITKDQQSIPGIEDPVRITKWAYTSEVNSVSNIFSQSDDIYIIAVLTEAREEGFAKLESVRAELTLAVKKEKKAEKLVEILNGQLAGVTDLSQFGTNNSENVGEATQIKFANTYVAGVGLEPYIVGASMYLPLDQISAPLVGESGVFVIAVTNRTEAVTAEGDDDDARSRLKYSLESRSNYEAYNALLDAAKVQDNRLDIFYN